MVVQKETHPGVAQQAEKIRGRTKENNLSVKAQADAIRGRSALTHDSIARRAEKISKLQKEIRLQILEDRLNNKSFEDILISVHLQGYENITLKFIKYTFKREEKRKKESQE